MFNRLSSAQLAVSWLLLLLSIALANSTSSSLPLPGKVEAVLPYCAYLTEKLPAEQKAQLRDGIQMYQYGTRRFRELEETIHFKRNPPTDEAQAFAWNTTRTVQELEQERDEKRKIIDASERNTKQLIEALKTAGQLPSNATQDYLSQCILGSLNKHLYPNQPQVSFLLQYSKAAASITAIVKHLRAATVGIAAELVVNVDSEPEHQIWAELSYATKGFVVPVFSARVNDIRGFNRIAVVARGSILVMLQEQLVPPEQPLWVHNLVRVFDKYPRAAAVGMHSYRTCSDSPNAYQAALKFQDPELQLGLQFVAMADVGVLAVRSAAFKAIGGLDEMLSELGTCGIWADYELTTRMWLDGWQVMFLQVDELRAGSDEAAANAADAECMGRQQAVAGSIVNDRFGSAVSKEICALVQQLTLQHMMVADANAPCPFKDGNCATVA